jgi:peptidoglycan biosynthesis protein MviN/MurJ (putative lipid II flippase)
VVFAAPVAQLLARGEMRTSSVVGQLAASLVVMAVAQLVGGVHDLGRQALFARLDERGPRLAGLIALIASLALAAASMALPAGGQRLLSLTLAILAGELAAAVTVVVRLRRAISPRPMMDPSALALPVVAAAAMLPIALAGLWVQSALPVSRAVQLVLLGSGVFVAVGVYLAALRGRLARRIDAAPS